MATKDAVYTGFWTNWSEGRIAGATLTVSSRDGAYLVAFLALFVNLAGARSWRILTYFIFRAKAATAATDDTTWKQLLILRNVASDFDAMWELGKVCADAKWRKSPVLLVLTAALHAFGLAVAGIFASTVINTRSDILLKPGQCGSWILPQLPSNEKQNIQTAQFEQHLSEIVTKSAQIAYQCYNASVALTETCNAYGRRLLEPTVTMSRHCPFDSSMCISNSAVQMDSGFISSLNDLGINSHPSESVSFRKRVTCTPMRTKGLTSTYSGANVTSDVLKFFQGIGQDIQGAQLTSFFYGFNVIFGTDATFVFDNRTFDTSMGSTLVPYRMQ